MNQHGTEDPIQECPECHNVSYVIANDRCKKCKYTRAYDDCKRCGEKISLDDQRYGGFCGDCAAEHDKVMAED